MLRDFDEWSTALSEATQLEALSNSRVGIEAAYYLSKLITKPTGTEPLWAALGGLPFRLRREVDNELDVLQSLNITPIFIFPGLHVGTKNTTTRASEALSNYSNEAWTNYDAHNADGAVSKFGQIIVEDRVYRALVDSNDGGETSPISEDDLMREFQSILRDRKIDYVVSPYTAWAQLAYLDKEQMVDSVVGSSEILLYNVETLITELNLDQNSFTFIRKQRCLTEFNANPELFLDAALLSGSSVLHTLPQLEGGPRRAKIRVALEMLNSHDKKGNNVVTAFGGEANPYVDLYRRSLLSIKHHAVLTRDGKVQLLNADDAPGDLHACIGQRLPDEIYFYLSKGAISPRILNWRTSAEIVEQSPLEGGSCPEYRTLVRDQLTTIRAIALSTLSHSIHRFYQHNDVTLTCWFERGNRRPIGLSEVADPKPIINSWNAKFPVFGAKLNQYSEYSLLGSTIFTLKDIGKQTVTKKEPEQLLKGMPEIIFNTFGRFLQLRGYVDSNHELTTWGEALHAAINAHNGHSELEEPIFLAMELARLGMLTHKLLFINESGAPMCGSKEDQRNTLLISRVASLGKLQHKAIGYTGPLNRHMLAYHSIIDAVRKTDRDLAEVSLTTLLLNGDASREEVTNHPDDLIDIGAQLPFRMTNDCGLGIAVLSVLDDMSRLDDPHSAEAKNILRERGPKDWFPNVENLEENVKSAYQLWDAVYAGAQRVGDMWTDKKIWDEANEWLLKRR